MAYLGLHMTERKLKINLEHYIRKNCDVEDTFYVVENSFWEEWTDVSEQFTPSKELQKFINNKKLLEPGHKQRFRENVEYGEDYVLVPKYVFKPL